MKHDHIPPELVKTFHSRALQLAAGGLGPARIARELSAGYSLRVTPETIRHWLVGDRNPLFRNTFKMEPSPALSYIIGANIGDGCALEKNWCVKLEVTDLEFAREFSHAMAKLFSRPRPNRIFVRHFDVNRLPLYTAKYSSKQLAKLLQSPLKRLLEFAFVFPREFLRGFFDAEGYTDVQAQTSFQVRVGAENSNKLLLTRINNVLESEFGVIARIYQKRRSGSIKQIRGKSFRTRRTSYALQIGGFEDVVKFGRLVGFSITRKDRKLRDAIAIFHEFGRRRGVKAWNRLYTKRGGEWIRR